MDVQKHNKSAHKISGGLNIRLDCSLETVQVLENPDFQKMRTR